MFTFKDALVTMGIFLIGVVIGRLLGKFYLWLVVKLEHMIKNRAETETETETEPILCSCCNTRLSTSTCICCTWCDDCQQNDGGDCCTAWEQEYIH